MFTISRNSLYQGSLFRGLSVLLLPRNSKLTSIQLRDIWRAQRWCKISGGKAQGYKPLPDFRKVHPIIFLEKWNEGKSKQCLSSFLSKIFCHNVVWWIFKVETHIYSLKMLQNPCLKLSFNPFIMGTTRSTTKGCGRHIKLSSS